MTLLSGLEQIARENEPLADYTWFGIGGEARFFFEPRTIDELKDVARRCRENDIAMRVLGSGSNILVPDSGVEGAVIRLSGDFEDVTFVEDGVEAGAAFRMSNLVLRTIREGRSGLEGLTGVPGSVGGCVRINAGGAFGDVGSAVSSVSVMNDEGDVFDRQREDLIFEYRSSNITSRFILGARFSLREDEQRRIMSQVKKIWIYKKNTQPVGSRNSGCIFKNPRGMSAGALIEKAGLKGTKIGGAEVSEKHANFIVVNDGATAFDVLKLIDLVRDKVAREFNIHLEKEIEVW